MAALSVSSSDSNYASCQTQNGGADSEQFPAGLRVLVVDDDNICLTITKKMLLRCHYQVTTSTQAKEALNLLRERKGCFDVVLSDVHMPDMDGYKLLEYVGLEMDLPVIMMSADGRTSAVMKGIKHGACDYLIKPIRQEALKNLWQHVVRRKWHENKEIEHSGSLDENDRYKQGNDDVDYAYSMNEGSEGALKSQRKRSHAKEEDDGEPDSDDPTTSKKPRVVWSVELHEQFVNAVNHLGIDKAVPKRILELMNVPGLTRENVASHLQKFRLFLKKMSVVGQQNGPTSAYSGPLDSNLKFHSLGRFDIQALAASGQIPPQTLAAMNAEFLGRPTGSSHVATVDPPAVFQACQSNVSKYFPQNLVSIEDVSSVYGAWPNAKFGPTNTPNGNLLVDILPELNHSNNVQPSCLVSASVNQNCNFNGSSMVNYSNAPEGHLKSTGALSGYSDNGFSRQVQNSTVTFGFAPNVCDVQGIYGLKSAEIIDQGQFGNLGFVGKRASVPTRFAVDEYEAMIPNFIHESNGNKVKRELDVPVSQQFPPMMS